MTTPTPHTHEQRAEIVERLVEMHERELGSNLHGLATQGSFARDEDAPYSDLEIVAFLYSMPRDAQWVDREQVYDGMFVDIVWTTKDEYVARVKEVTPQWYLAGSDHLGRTRVNPELIDEINAFTPQDLRARCLTEAEKRWPTLHEATTKVFNAAAREHTPDLGRLVFAMLEHVLVELAFLNTHPYKSSSTSLEEALALPHQPRHLPELAAIATDGGFTDHAHVDAAVKAVFAEVTELLEAEGATLAVGEHVRLPALTAA